MNCEHCGAKSVVIDVRTYSSKRLRDTYNIRRRQCANGHRFTTYETRKNPEEKP